jgi:hypothetical protein
VHNKKKVVVLSAFGLFPMLEYELDIAQRELDQGNKVYFFYCGGGQEFCSANPNGWTHPKKRYCTECQSKVMRGINQLLPKSGSLLICDYEKLSKDTINLQTTLHAIKSQDHLHALQILVKSNPSLVEGDVYKAAYSSLITDLPASNPVIEKELEKFKLELLVGAQATYSASELLDKIKPDHVFVYNGRISRYRPLMRLCQNRKIALSMYEYPYFGHESYPVMPNTYVHDVDALAKYLKRISADSAVSNQDQANIGRKWFAERVNPTGNINPFAKRQEQASLPKYWNHDSFNIVFFPSTEHEVTSIDEVSHLQIYENQVEAIYKIASNITGSFNLTIRMHPNNTGDKILLDQYLSLEQKWRFIKIIPPDSRVDTYALMAASDLVMVHGSTVGAEAGFMGKRVLSIGRSQYDFFDACAFPRSHEEVLQIIKDSMSGKYTAFPDPELAKLEACKYAYALLNIGRKPKYIKKDGYRDGRFISGTSQIKLRANFAIRFINRLLDAPSLFYKGANALRNNTALRSRFIKNPYQELINYCKYIFNRELS